MSLSGNLLSFAVVEFVNEPGVFSVVPSNWLKNQSECYCQTPRYHLAIYLKLARGQKRTNGHFTHVK